MSDSMQGRVEVLLPVDLPNSIRDLLVTMGCAFSDAPADKVCEVWLPLGWTSQRDSRKDGTYLVDTEGNRRAILPGDSGVSPVSLLTRYRVEVQHTSQGRVNAVVIDGSEVLYTTISHLRGKMHGPQHREARAKAVAEAEAWLETNHPDWRRPLAYWGD